MKVNEIFCSLQGEGCYTGTAAVFVRLAGCNLSCPFCDTNHTPFTEMTEDEIVCKVKGYGVGHVVITGGEPTLQLNAKLLTLLHDNGMFVQIETNGTKVLPDGCVVDWVTCSPKEGGKVVIQHIDELKVLFRGNIEEIESYSKIKATEYRLQPLDTSDEAKNNDILKATIDYIIKNPMWKLSLQTHKMIGVR